MEHLLWIDLPLAGNNQYGLTNNEPDFFGCRTSFRERDLSWDFSNRRRED
jgi:hypothetical protein